MKYRFKSLLIILFVLIGNSIFAQEFGENKVQYTDFNWQYIQSEHFDIYFYQGGYDIARFTAEAAESAYVSLRNDFNYDLVDRVSIITYKSHNDFQQTNVVYSFLTEGIGGVTELFKNRVVIPYEGSYSQYRHVIHHELTHAVMNDMLYGGSIQSLISGQVAPLPLWVSEGLAEYESLRWDTRLDMVVRDATLTGYLPPIEFLDYFPYQGGASVFRYIAQKYGNQKIGEILNKIKGSFSFQNAFKSAIGIDFKELTEEWQRRMKREYWPDIADRKEPSEIAKPLTDHREDHSYINSSAAISPQGDRIVFLSNRDGKMSIYLMDVMEGKIIKKLISGEADVNFEELHFLEPGFGWSPDGRKITLAAKAGDADALYIYDIDNDSYKQYKFESLDGIFSTAWSPNGNEIAFVGNHNGASDIYLFSLETEKIEKITDDVFSDHDPNWSPDGKQIVFTSDRGSHLKGNFLASEFDIHNHDFDNDDIYIVNRDGSDMRRITEAETKEEHAIFAPSGDKIAYVSEQNGIANIFIHDLVTTERWPVTNLITGAYQISWDKNAQKMVFTSFYRGGYDIYLLKDPLNLEPVTLKPTEYFKRLEEGDDFYLVENIKSEEQNNEKNETGEKAPLVKDYSKYVFADMNRRTQNKPEKVTLNESDYKSANGEYKINKYKIKFSPDLVNGAAGYSTFFGVQGFTQILLSDMLGNHQIYIGTNLVFDLRNSNIFAQYWYLPNRIDWGFGAFHISNFFRTYYEGLIRFRNYGASLLASRPFDKFTRIELGLTWFNVNMEYLEIPLPSETISTILPSAALIHDQVEWGMTGPKQGTRASFSVLASPKYTSNGLEFTTLKGDYRKYIDLFGDYSLAFRLYAGTSLGHNPQRFFLGGVQNWLNREFKGGLRINNIEDVYFSEFVTPLRGAAYYERDGTSFGLFNFEFRFPLIPLIQLGIPPIRLGNIQGVFFTDIGSAWDHLNEWKGTKKDANGNRVFDDILAGYGVGARIFFLGFLVKFDVAWRYDISSVSKPIYYWSFGADL